MLHNMFWYPGMTLDAAEKVIIESALKFCRGNKEMTASMLGIARTTLERKLDCIKGKYAENYDIKEPRKNRKLAKNENKKDIKAS